MRIILTFFFCIFFIPFLFASYDLKPGDKLIEDFESITNELGGNYGTFGAAQGSNYIHSNVYSGKKAFKLIFAKNVSIEPDKEVTFKKPDKEKGFSMKRIGRSCATSNLQKVDWAVFTINMGPIIDDSADPVVIKPMDISEYKYLVFWVRGRLCGEKFKVYVRDSSATTYEPNVKVEPRMRVTRKWEPVVVNLDRIKNKVDLKNVVQIGVGFGKKDGNRMGNILYIDYFVLVK